jgi:hypothetical protein
MMLKGPNPDVDGVVRWRCADLRDAIAAEFPSLSGMLARSRLAKSVAIFVHQSRMLSWVTMMPRSARISAASHRLRPNT